MIVMILKNNKSSLITQIIKRNIKKAVNTKFSSFIHHYLINLFVSRNCKALQTRTFCNFQSAILSRRSWDLDIFIFVFCFHVFHKKSGIFSFYNWYFFRFLNPFFFLSCHFDGCGMTQWLMCKIEWLRLNSDEIQVQQILLYITI